MSAIQLKMWGLSLAAVVVFASGILLRKRGRPFGTALLTVHKLVNVGAFILIGKIVWEFMRFSASSPPQSSLFALTGIAILGAVASGGALSATDSAPAWVGTLHRAAPWFVVSLTAASLFIVFNPG